MSKKESLRILKLLCNLETVVFENRTNVPDYISDELLSVVDLLTETILSEATNNDHLIAAAPKMLEALTACDEAMAYMGEYNIPLCLPEKVKNAIKKAKGEGDENRN